MLPTLQSSSETGITEDEDVSCSQLSTETDNAASIFAEAAEQAPTANELTNARDQYLADRVKVKAMFVEKVQGVIKSLEKLRGIDGKKLHVIVQPFNFKEKDALKDDGSYKKPEILIAAVYEKSLPYKLENLSSWRDLRREINSYASFYNDGKRLVSTSDTSMNGFFLTSAKTRTYEKVRDPSFTYYKKPVLGLNIDAKNLHTVRYDILAKEKNWDAPWSTNEWHSIFTSHTDGLSAMFNEISDFLVKNATLPKKDLIALGEALDKPYKPSLWQQFKNWRAFG